MSQQGKKEEDGVGEGGGGEVGGGGYASGLRNCCRELDQKELWFVF